MFKLLGTAGAGFQRETVGFMGLSLVAVVMGNPCQPAHHHVGTLWCLLILDFSKIVELSLSPGDGSS